MSASRTAVIAGGLLAALAAAGCGNAAMVASEPASRASHPRVADANPPGARSSGNGRSGRPETRPLAKVCTGGVLRHGGDLQRFADSLRRGSTGCLRGIHRGGVDIRRPGVTLRSVPGQRATILGGQVRFSPAATGAAVRRLRLVGDPISPLIYASRAALSDNVITNRHTGICIHIDRYPGTRVPAEVVIRDNRIHDCGRLPATNHDHGIYIAVAERTAVRDNLIYDNADRGVQLWPLAHRTRVVGNVIDGNGQGVIFGGSSDRNLVARNIISNSVVRHNVESYGSSATANVVRDNCLWSADPGYYGGDPPHSGVLQGHPGFVLGPNAIAEPRFRDRRDFEPVAGSRCAGIGASGS